MITWGQLKKAFVGETREEKIEKVRANMKAKVPALRFHGDVETFVANELGTGISLEEMDETIENFKEDVYDFVTACIEPTRGWYDTSGISEKMRSSHYQFKDIYTFVGKHSSSLDKDGGYFDVVHEDGLYSRYNDLFRGE